jgi:ADP-ribose pyrophosphatase YjhB (NUDIX family)
VSSAFIERPPSVALVIVDGDQMVCVRQARPATGTTTTELPHEKLEDGEEPVQAGVRGLAEECGLVAEDWRVLGSFFAVPAYSTELVHVLCARATSSTPSGTGHHEQIEVLLLHVDDVANAVDDAVSLAALQLWERRAQAG